MSVIVAKSVTCSSTTTPVVYNCIPAVVIHTIIPAGATVVIDSVPSASFQALKWNAVISSDTQHQIESYEVLATHRSGTLPTYVQYGLMGDRINHTNVITANGGVMSWSITNNEVFDLIVHVMRKGIPLSLTTTNVHDVVEVGNIDTFVGVGMSTTVDFVEAGSAASVKWIIVATDQLGNKRSTQVYAQLIGSVVAVEYGRLGPEDNDLVITVTEVIGFGVELAIENATTTPLALDITRIPTELVAGPEYCGPTRGLSLWIPNQITVPVGVPTNIDTIDSSHAGVKWLLAARLPTGECLATEIVTSGGDIVTYGRIGDRLDVGFSVDINGTNRTLVMVNNSLLSLTVNTLRVPVAV